MNAFHPLQTLESPLQVQWRDDRALRQRVRPGQSWRGCMGLAVMFDPAVPAHAHGPHRLVPNAAVTWVALRDVPAGRWRPGPSRPPREVHWAGTAKADLHYGMPRIDFAAESRHAVDFGLCPFGRRERRLPDGRRRQVTARGDVLNSDDQPGLFAVLNRMSAAMTRFAFTAVHASGNPVRPLWFAHRPVKEVLWPTTAPRDWMPRPYLGFESSLLDPLYDRISLEHAPAGVGDTGERSEMNQPLRPGFCPALRQAFCSAVAQGLPLHARDHVVYLGIVPQNTGRRGESSDRLRHTFAIGSTGQRYHVHLPPSARVEVRVGDSLLAGQRWCCLVPQVPFHWKNQAAFEQWSTLHRLADRRSLGALQRRWFCDQAIQVPDRPTRVFLPAPLVSRIVHDLRPCDLLWDVVPADRYVDPDLQAAILPPLRLGAWDRLRWSINDILLDARITDPRLQVEHRIAPREFAPPTRQHRDRSTRLQPPSPCLLAG